MYGKIFLSSLFSVIKTMDEHDRLVADFGALYAIEGEVIALSEADMRRMSNFNIQYKSSDVTSRDCLDHYAGYFGPTNNTYMCERCSVRGCLGHSGLIEFPIDRDNGRRICVYDPGLMGRLRLLVKCVCTQCRRIRADVNDPKVRNRIEQIKKLPREFRLEQLFILIERGDPKQCLRCYPKGNVTLLCSQTEELQSEGSLKGEIKIKCTSIDNTRRQTKNTDGSEKAKIFRVQPSALREHLAALSDEDREIVGMSANDIDAHFTACCLVQPLWGRPKTSAHRSDEYTINFDDIITACASYEYGTLTADELEKTLFRHITNIHKHTKGIFKEKKGLVRNRAYARRTEQAARMTTIPSRAYHPNFGNLLIPKNVANQLSRPEMVVSSNIQRLQQLMFAGRIKMNNPVHSNTPWVPSISTVAVDNFSDRSNHFLQEGDRVNVAMGTGDVIITARQPTNNKHNIQGVVAVVTNALDVAEPDTNVLPEMGGDHDGDQHLIGMLQTPEAIEEARTVMFIGSNIRSAQNGTPVIPLHYHTALAATLLTIDPAVRVDDQLYAECITKLTGEALDDWAEILGELPDLQQRLDKYGISKFSGHGLFSLCLPKDFAYTGKASKDADPAQVIIREGVMLQGILTGAETGRGTGGIIDRMSIQFASNPKVTFRFINRATGILQVYLDHYGFTVNYSDYDIADRSRVTVTSGFLARLYKYGVSKYSDNGIFSLYLPPDLDYVVGGNSVAGQDDR